MKGTRESLGISGQLTEPVAGQTTSTGPPTEQFRIFAVIRMKLAGTEKGPWTITLERSLSCGANEEITNWQKDRGVCKIALHALFYYKEHCSNAQRYSVPTAE